MTTAFGRSFRLALASSSSASNDGGAGPWIEITRHDTNGGLTWRTHEISTDDLLTYHTIGLGYQIPINMPVDVSVNYTITQEEGSSAIDNDLIEALVQMVW